MERNRLRTGEIRPAIIKQAIHNYNLTLFTLPIQFSSHTRFSYDADV